MLDLIKWFWTSINFRNWTFEGRKLANPLLIIWRMFWLMPYFAILFIYCVIAAIYSLDISEFTEKWENN